MRALYGKILAALVLSLGLVNSALAERILIDDADQTVTLTSLLNCDRPAYITVDTALPGIYEQDTARLQSIADSVRAMLAYECPQMTSIHITGLVRGLDEVIYRGKLEKSGNWLLASESGDIENTHAARQSGDDATKDWEEIHNDGRILNHTLMLTDLALGMSIEEATGAILKSFGKQPVYNAKKGLLRLESGPACPEPDTATETLAELPQSTICLDAWFSDSRIARLEQIELLQVTRAQMPQVQSLFTRKYGSPNLIRSSEDNNGRQLVWMALSDGQEQVPHQLTTLLTTAGGDLVISQTSLEHQPDNGPLAQNAAELDLKL